MNDNAKVFLAKMMNEKGIKKDQIKELEGKLNSSKVFVNMIIHDFRNPTIC